MEFFDNKEFLEHAKTAINFVRNGMLVVDLTRGGGYSCIFTNEYMAQVLGYTYEELKQITQKSVREIVYPADWNLFVETVKNVPDEGTSNATGRFQKKSGEAVWFLGHLQKIAVYGKIYVAAVLTNVNDMIGTQKQLEDDTNKWSDIVNSVPIGLGIFNISSAGVTQTIAINDMLVNFSNDVGRALDQRARQWTKEELSMLLNQTIYAFTTSEDIPLVRRMLEESKTKRVTDCRFHLRGSTKENFRMIHSLCYSKEVDDFHRNYYVTFQDVTTQVIQEEELKKQQAELMRLSYFDSLTGASNRNAYNAFIERCKEHRLFHVGIAFMDLNGLKSVNDSLGHNAGDRMFTQFIGIVGQFFSPDQVFRISGDEFVIVEPEVDKERFSVKMRHLMERLADAGNLASTGYIWKDNVSDLRRRVKQAESIMYVEKQRYYETARTISSKHRPRLLEELLRDLENERYVMYLQPKSRINEKKACGAEALVRKVDENGTIIPPYEFIPALEHERLIPKIDFFMLEEVCKFLEKLKKEGNKDFKISVNMSRVTLVENEYMKTVSDICNKYNFNRNQLEFEVTESNETLDRARLEDYISQIKELGIGISLDDVGTDYSSLPMLLINGVDVVKLDRSLTIRIEEEKAKRLLKHMMSMCHDLGLSVIAEGVETDTVRKELAEMGCDQYQGYLMSRPVAAAEFKRKFL